jgi:virginiamycin A acetyltransferase
MLRDVLKSVLRGTALLIVSPLIASYFVKAWIIGRDRALEGSTQTLSLLPGVSGRYLRVAFLRCVLAHCDPSAAIEFGTIFSQAGTRIGRDVYIGPRCHIGLADIERDVLIGAAVHIPSGANTHGTEELDVPLREQGGHRTMVRVGRNSWIGSAAIVMADVGEQTIVGAGSVVTKALPAQVKAVGAPARVLGPRGTR